MTAALQVAILVYVGIGTCWANLWLFTHGIPGAKQGMPVGWVGGGIVVAMFAWPLWLMVAWDDWKFRRTFPGRRRLR